MLHAGPLDPRALIDAVESAGYKASTELAEDRLVAERQRRLARRGRLLALAVALTAPALAIAMFAPDFPGKAWVLPRWPAPGLAVVGWEFHAGARRTAFGDGDDGHVDLTRIDRGDRAQLL